MPRPKAAPAAKKPRVPKNTHVLAEALPAGEVLTDQFKRTWCLGTSAGCGGFGLIYLASAGEKRGQEDYVIKVEPHTNGPLFCELNFYQRAAKPEFISAWLSSRKKKALGIPKFISFGSYERNGARYRFMVMERFGTDLQKLFEQNGKKFSRKTVLELGLSLVDSLEYIHDKGFAHADIKASNLLLGYTKATQNQVFLVDYGLAYRFSVDGKQKEYKEDPRKAHDGTIEFTSRDSHLGVTPSPRADLEILGYCLVQWLCGRLPWEGNLLNKDYVRDQKIKHMKNIPSFLKTCFPNQSPEELQQYLQYVVQLDYQETPDYSLLRSIFSKALKKNGLVADGKLDFSAPKKKSISKGARKRKELLNSDEDSDDVQSSPEMKKRGSRGGRSPRGGRLSGTPTKHASKAVIPGSDSPFPKAAMNGDLTTPSHASKRPTLAKSPPSPRKQGTSSTRPTLAKSPPIPSTSQRNTPAKSVGNAIIPVRWQPKKGSATKAKVASPARRRTSKENGVVISPVVKGGVIKAKDRKQKVISSSVATQTSPGLKGLKRSWKK